MKHDGDAVLPARVDELERAQLELELVRSEQANEQLRHLLAEEESASGAHPPH
jgi:hypothetical protein